MNYKNITIVSVDGRVGDSTGSQLALKKSHIELPGSKMLLISPQKPRHLMGDIEHIEIKEMGYLEYNLFIIYALHAFVASDYALIVQPDGWVLNGKNWRSEYFDYDYVGAPLAFAKHNNSVLIGQDEILRNISHIRDMDFCLNGGFSLRSKRLLKWFWDNRVPYIIPAPNRISSSPNMLSWEPYAPYEDVFISIEQRDELKKGGINVAPLSIAKYFSIENTHAFVHNSTFDFSRLFGHHSKHRFITDINPLTVQWDRSRDPFAGGERIVDLLKSYGYSISD